MLGGWVVILGLQIALLYVVVIRPIALGEQSIGMKVANTAVIDQRTGEHAIGHGRSWGRAP